ncbi:MAG: DUF2115 domain-containing protein [Methanoregulaceae archaeon]
MDSIIGPHRDLAHFPDEREYIQGVCNRIQDVQTRGDLGTSIAREVSHYSVYDLQIIGGKLNREIDRLPSPYRDAVRPFFQSQIFGTHHTLLAMHRSGGFSAMREPLRNRHRFLEFCDMVPEGCFRWDPGDEMHSTFYRARHRFFYYLISGFAMFVLDRPGHPVGTPFPGGFRVEEKNGLYYCPVRDHEKEVSHSLCNLCPALQADMQR